MLAACRSVLAVASLDVRSAIWSLISCALFVVVSLLTFSALISPFELFSRAIFAVDVECSRTPLISLALAPVTRAVSLQLLGEYSCDTG